VVLQHGLGRHETEQGLVVKHGLERLEKEEPGPSPFGLGQLGPERHRLVPHKQLLCCAHDQGLVVVLLHGLGWQGQMGCSNTAGWRSCAPQAALPCALEVDAGVNECSPAHYALEVAAGVIECPPAHRALGVDAGVIECPHVHCA